MERAVRTAETSALAVWSLVLGILSMTCFGLFSGIPAVICGHMAQSRIRGSGGTLSGDGLAIGGLVTGYMGTVLTTFAVVGLLAGMLLPAVASARERARRAHCMSNLSQIGLACKMYAMDHGEKLPPNLAALADYVGDNPSVFVCASSETEPGDLASVDTWSDYILVPNRSEGDPGDAVLVFEKPGCHSGRGGNILTVDGAVRWCRLEDYERLTAEFRR
jgi:prepilin-type processing-associated H-X9-DG protein